MSQVLFLAVKVLDSLCLSWLSSEISPCSFNYALSDRSCCPRDIKILIVMFVGVRSASKKSGCVRVIDVTAGMMTIGKSGRG